MINILWRTPLNTNHFVIVITATGHILFKLSQLASLSSTVTQVRCCREFATSRHFDIFIPHAPRKIAETHLEIIIG